MTLHRQITFAGIFAAVAVAVFVACSGFTPVGTDGQGSLTVNPRTEHVNVGQAVQLTAAGATGAVSWSSTNASVATVSSGRVTGVGSGTATIQAVSGTSQASASITVTRAAAIALSTTNVSFDEIPSAPTLADSQVVDVTDGGEDALAGLTVSGITYAVGASDWLSATLTGASAPAKLILRPKTSALPAGSYSATVAITSATASAGTQMVTVQLNLVRPPAITLAASGATFSAQQNNAAPAQQSIGITNGGDAPLTGLSTGTVTYTGGATGWLDVSLSASVAPSTILLRPNTTALAPGDYSATIPIVSVLTGVAPVSVIVTYHVTAAPTPPTIVLSSNSVPFSATNGQAVPGSTTINITNSGQTALTGLTSSVAYVPPTAGTWLTVSLSGTTAPATLTIQPNTTGLTAGTYAATITIASPVASNQSLAINVTYTVQRPASIVLASFAPTFSVQQGAAAPTSQTIAVTDGGDVPLTGLALGTITYTGGQTGWLTTSINPSTAPAILTLQPNNTALPLADYSATFTVTSTVPGVAPQTVTVTYHVTAVPPPPVMQLDKASMSFNGVIGASAPLPQTLTVNNGGAVALTGVTVTATYGAGASNWLTLTPSGTTAPLTVTVQPNTTGLAAATYTATVSVASAVATNSPQTMNVTYVVQRPASIVLAATTASFSAQQSGTTPTQQSIGITNGGDVTLPGLAVGTITYSPGASNWLVASVTPATAPASLLLQPNTTGLPAGDYMATVPVTSNVAGVAPASVTVTYHVIPTIIVNPTTLTFTVTRGGSSPATQPVGVSSNPAGAVMGLAANVTYTGPTTNWLNTTFLATSTNTTLNVTPNTTAIAGGTYSATIHVSSTTPGAVTKDIPVTYKVNELVISQSPVAFTTTGKVLPAAKTITVTNAGPDPLGTVTLGAVSYSSLPINLPNYQWLNPVVSSASSSSATITLNITLADSSGDFSGQFTISATGLSSKTAMVTYTRKTTIDDVFPTVFSKCQSCHVDGFAPGSVSFSSTASTVASLISPTTGGKTFFTITGAVGDSSEAGSYLVRMIDGVEFAQHGNQNMPPSCSSTSPSTCLSASDRMRIYLWIFYGAIH